ncbi:MAG: leucine-rich repeat protein [Oscillospiraceae bacterium]
MKKLLSLLLSLSILAGLFVLPVYASPESIPEAEPAAEAITETVDAEPAEPEYVPVEPEEAPAETEESPAEPEEAPVTDGDGIDPIDAVLGDAPEDPEVTSGAISGTDIQWAVDKETGVLTVTGTGVLPDYENFEDTPWRDCRAIIKKIVVSAGITAIGENNFRYLPLVTEVSLPDGLTTIGGYAFYYDLSLTSIVLPDSVTTIKDSAFADCHALKNVTFSKALKTIGKSAFSDAALEAIDLPDGLTYIGESAFFSRYATYTELTLPGSLGAMETVPFTDYDKLVTATLEEGITVVPPYFFYVSYNLKTLNLPSTIEVLGESFINPYFFSLEDDDERKPKLETINVADRDGYDFFGWTDEAGMFFTSEEICAGAEYTGNLYSTWLRSWTEGMFTDVRSAAWYHDAVQICYQLELMNGMSATTFKPMGSGTRAQTVTILYRLAGEPEVTSSTSFSDVKAGLWYSDAVAWASEVGITTGYPDGTFRPDNAVSRQEFVTFLYRMSVYLELVDKDTAWSEAVLGDFPDKNLIASWALNAEAWSVAVGLQQGSRDSDGIIRLRPTSTVTRAQLATFLFNYCLGEWLEE